MKVCRKLALLCAVAVAAQAAALDREAFSFTRYDLEIRVEPDQQRLSARGKITLRNDSAAPQKNLSLQISSSLDWRSIQLNGKPVQFLTQPYPSDIDHTGGLSEAIVSLPQPVAPNTAVELEVGYEGVIPLDLTRLTKAGVPEETAKHSDWDQIGKAFTAVRGIGYVTWYPVAMESADLSDGSALFDTLYRWKQRSAQSDLQVNLCEARKEGKLQTLLMNDPPAAGVPAGSAGGITDGSSWMCTEHKFSPLGLSVPAFLIGSYSVLSRPQVDIQYLEGNASAAEDYALVAELAFPFVNQWFGNLQQKAEVIDLADAAAAPAENGTVLITPLKGMDPRGTQLAAVHQLTHAVFPSPRPWIYEGLAHFAQAAYRERQESRQAALEFMGQHQASVVDVEKAIDARHDEKSAAAESLINTGTEELYRSKAMFVWWMLRDIVGEDTLKKALAGYRPDEDKAPSYVQKLVEAQAKRDLEWFFDDWVYRDKGLPDFKVESAFVRATVGGGSIVTVNVENLGNAGADVPVTLRVEGGEVTKRLLVMAKGKNSIRMEAAASPKEVVVNDGSVPESDLSNNTYKLEPAAK